ncbi:hypothetical protein AAG906_022954 [Vitis piasezkii]
MADALLSASLQVLFDRLASPELVNFIRGQKLSQELLTDFKRKLLVVHKALNDAEVKQFSDPLVKEWLVQVKDVVYHAEDLLDEIATEALRCEIEAAEVQTGGIYQVWNKFSTRSRVKGLMTRLENIAKEKVELELKEGDGEKLSPKLPSSSLVDDSFVYGRGEIKEELVKWLLSDKETAAANNVIDVMSIVGMGGSGKTTLAQLLYNDDRVKEHFHLKAWVCVSTEFLLIDLLQRQLKDNLGNKKFLLVLDDVWDVESLDWESWDRLRTPLHAAAQGSKIVVTSRSETVAKVMRAIHTHQLGTLSPEDSWSLFTKLAFPNGDPCAYPQLEPIGREIVKKCQGLPLAVKALGSLLLSYQHLSLAVKRCFAYCSIFPKDYEFHKEKLILLWMAEGLLHSGQSNRRMEEVGDSYFNELLANNCRSLLELPSKMGRLINLRYLDVSGTDSLKEMPNDIDQLKSLQKLPNFTVGKESGFRFGELWKLSEIRGRLEISKMENVVGVEDALQANMKDKKYLDELSLNWSYRPWYEDDLSNCRKCSTLPPLGQLPCLERIEISEMSGVVMVGSEFYGILLPRFIPPSHPCKLYHLKICPIGRNGYVVENSLSNFKIEISDVSQLKQLPVVPTISTLENVILWIWKFVIALLHIPKQSWLTHYIEITINLSLYQRLEELCISISEGDPTSLRNLMIYSCPNLVYIQLPALDSMCHEIYGCSKLKILRLLAHTHSSLQKLRLEDCPELLLHREGLPSNLRELEIRGCNQLTSQVDWDLQRLASLTHFTIDGGCEGVELFPKECLLPSSLTFLSIENLPNLKSLDNKGLQQLTSLRGLCIENCPELQFSTASVLQRLISLKKLRIWSCERLQSLTEAGLHHLTTLETLIIYGCPNLQYLTKRDCQTPLSTGCLRLSFTGTTAPIREREEWRYISHIPK